MSIIKIIIAFLFFAALTKKLPDILKEIRKAQIFLVIESRSSSWGKPWVPD